MSCGIVTTVSEISFLWFGAGWIVGYLVRGFFTFIRAFRTSAILVEKTADQSLQLLGSTVYNVSLMDQLYKQAMVTTFGEENGKIVENELDHEFNIWKKKTIKEFIENYPESYKWQLEFNDWEGAMNNLTDIYKRDKLEHHGVHQK